jgi:hypothetical protein
VRTSVETVHNNATNDIATRKTDITLQYKLCPTITRIDHCQRSIIMPSLDGISRPSLAGIKQASSSAFNKAQLMVGLKREEDLEAQQQTSQTESSQRQRPSFVDEAADLLCPELTFQQVCSFFSQNLDQKGAMVELIFSYVVCSRFYMTPYPYILNVISVLLDSQHALPLGVSGCNNFYVWRWQSSVEMAIVTLYPRTQDIPVRLLTTRFLATLLVAPFVCCSDTDLITFMSFKFFVELIEVRSLVFD